MSVRCLGGTREQAVPRTLSLSEIVARSPWTREEWTQQVLPGRCSWACAPFKHGPPGPQHWCWALLLPWSRTGLLLSTGKVQVPYQEVPYMVPLTLPLQRKHLRSLQREAWGSRPWVHFPSRPSRASACLGAEQQAEGAQGCLCKWWPPAWCVCYSEKQGGGLPGGRVLSSGWVSNRP